MNSQDQLNSPQNLNPNQLFETVVNGGYCIGCGACASLENSPVRMELNEFGMFQPTMTEASERNYEFHQDMPIRQVCPFSGQGPNEDEIAAELFGQECKYDKRIGYYSFTYAGFVRKGGFREQGSSGGMGTWIISKLLEQNLVDSVIHVHAQESFGKDTQLFRYQISTTSAQVAQGAKSRYYPIEISEIIQEVRKKPGRYAIVGIPCFIKAIRLLTKNDKILAERILYCVGLVCGHLKSTKFADMFAWQCGIKPGNLTSIDFRKKLPDQPANRYGIEVTGLINGKTQTVTKSTVDLYGRVWGLGFFKYKACDYCDDVIAETADVVVGDAWLPQYVQDSQGTNIVVVRNPIIQKILNDGLHNSEISLDLISPSDVAHSQESGLKHRREGLSYRLYLADKEGKWRPNKRIAPRSLRLNKKLQRRYLLRMLLSQKSHEAFQLATQMKDFRVFVKRMNPLLSKYESTYSVDWFKKVERVIRNIVKKLARE